MRRMVFASSLLGALTGWFIVISLGTVLGLVVVIAWRRWGDRVTMPPEMKRVAERMLGPQGAPTPTPATRTTATAAPETTQAGAPSDNLPEAPSEAPSSPAPVQATQTAPVTQVTEERTETGPEGGAIPQDPEDGDDVVPEVPPLSEGPEAPEREEAPPRTLTRADAIEEISLLFDAPYEAATALIESGLWGMDNHEEYARAMRGKNPPSGVAPALFTAIVNADPRDYQEILEKLRAKRHSMNELSTLWGVGPEQAEALYEAGFRDLESIRKTSTEKLAKTPGIGHALAFQIRAAAHGLAPTP